MISMFPQEAVKPVVRALVVSRDLACWIDAIRRGAKGGWNVNSGDGAVGRA
jgi:hypothetical protein